MQTYILHREFNITAKALDTQRLATQAKEAMLIHKGCLPLNHPVYLMWEKYKPFLALYGMSICQEFMNRTGKAPSPIHYFIEAKKSCQEVPAWWANSKTLFRIQVCHAANLRRKNKNLYEPIFHRFLPISYWDNTPCAMDDKVSYWYPVEVGRHQSHINNLWEKYFKEVGI